MRRADPLTKPTSQGDLQRSGYRRRVGPCADKISQGHAASSPQFTNRSSRWGQTCRKDKTARDRTKVVQKDKQNGGHDNAPLRFTGGLPRRGLIMGVKGECGS